MVKSDTDMNEKEFGRRFKTNQDYHSEFLTQRMFLVEDENEFASNEERERKSLVEVINVIDGEADLIFNSFGSIKDKETRDRFVEKVVKVEQLLKRRLVQLFHRFDNLPFFADRNDFQLADEEQEVVATDDKGSVDRKKESSKEVRVDAEEGLIQAEISEIVEILGFVETALRCIPQDTDLHFAGFLREVGRNFELKDGMATPIQFREWLYDKITQTVEDDTKEKIGVADIKFPMGDAHISILDLYIFFRDPSRSGFFPGYGSEFSKIFAYANWRLGSRKHEINMFDNYVSLEGLRDVNMTSNLQFTHDGTVMDVLKGMERTKDVFETPFSERARAATLIYENLHIIALIAEQENKKKLGLDESASSQEVWQTKIRKLRGQRHLAFLTDSEAAFLLRNIKNFMPWERATEDELRQTRATIQLFCSADTIRRDDLKDGSTNQYNELLNGLIVKVDNGKVVLSRISGGNVVSVASGETKNKLDKMLKYGERAEGGAFSMFWVALQAAQADTGAVGYMKEAVWAVQHLLYAERYLFSDYSGLGPNLIMARSIPRILMTFYAQMMVRHPKTGEMISMTDLMADEEFDFSQELQISTMVPMGEGVRLGDNLKRAKDMITLIEKGLFSDEFAGEVDSFYTTGEGINVPKKRDAFSKAYKILKYEVEMYPPSVIINDLDQLVGEIKIKKGDGAGKSFYEIIKEKIVAYSASNDPQEKEELWHLIKMYWIRSQMYSLVESGLVMYVRNKPSLLGEARKNVRSYPNLTEEELIRLIKSDRNLLNDLKQLRWYLEGAGEIRTRGELVDNKVRARSFNIEYNEKGQRQDLTKDESVYEGFFGSLVRTSLLEAFRKPVIVKEEMMDSYDLYVE